MSRKFLLAELLDEGAHGVGHFGAHFDPGIELFSVDAQGAGVGAGVVVADEFQRTAVATGIAVDGHDAVEGTLLGSSGYWLTG